MTFDLSREEEINTFTFSGVLMADPVYGKTKKAEKEFLQLLVGVNFKQTNKNGAKYPANSKFLVFFWQPEYINLAKARNLRKTSRVTVEGPIQTNKILSKKKKYAKSDLMVFKARKLELDNYNENIKEINIMA